MNIFFQCKIFIVLTGLIKNSSTQNSLLIIIAKLKQYIDKNEKVGTIFMDLSKAFEKFYRNLLFVKLNTFNTIKFGQNYFSE